MITFNYQNTNERDIDRIICEELYCSQEFFELFLAKVNRSGATICNIEHSKRAATMGETDIEVIYDFEGNKYGMLIEDKITAKKQDTQPERYRLRGDNGVKAGDYCSYHTFMVAPQSYINNPLNDADKYDHWVTHDEIADYFKKSRDSHSEFRMKCFKSSLEKHRFSAQNIKAENIPDFFVKYAAFLEECDIENVQINKLPQGKKKISGWVNFVSDAPNTYIEHKIYNKDPDNNKIHSGFVELHFSNYPIDKMDELHKAIDPIIAKNDNLKDVAKLRLIGTSEVAVRMKVEPIHRDAELEGQKPHLRKIFNAISDMYNLSKSISTLSI